MKNAQRLLIALPFAFSLIGSALAQDPPQSSTPTQLVDALNGVFGKHAGARAVHAKGTVLEGRFTPSPAAAAISKAPHLQATAVPVTVRFSNFAGIPDIPDNHGLASPRGLAVRFSLPGGGSTDIVAHSFNGFPSPTADDFRDLLIALGTSGPDVAKPTPLDGYLGTHPVAKAFLTAPKPAPQSFATLPYYGVNTFRFINAAGKVTFGRYQFLPVSGSHFLSEAQTAKAKPDYLSDEIQQRIAKGAVRFKLVVQQAAEGDKLDDPSIAWPASRPVVELGTLEITQAVADNVAAQKSLMFLPNNVPAGIEPQDPMINARSAAYPVSFGRRQ
ncbi:catalase family peroxidase [Pseudomonas sp. BIGb0164]|uniref:catalase family peroxidase n=1 Tax=Pseudomonas sp. BIGb0164 TaxID=2940605 RepID=UPI002168DA16|nr:catalase family peroxidase [Pseudomonas sp. BIGb0164]MCS4250149.1 catalase [Pseudomonas sp. BIGb0164]